MSDPITNVEIEDVLTSIRRLIGEGAQSPSSATFEAGTQDGPGRERLVLTPALRVIEPRLPVTGRQEGDGKQAGPARADHAGQETYRLRAGDSVLDGQGLNGGSLRAGRVDGVVSARQWDRAPEAAGQAPASASAAGRSRMRGEEAPVFRSRQGTPLVLDRRVVPAGEPAFRHAPATDTAPAANGPARGAGGGAAGTDGPARNAARQGADGIGLRLVDEVMLRRIVSEIIQQELQGALGERITHNLRRLVRREIARAMDGDEDP